MKLITAIVRPYHLETLQAALERHNVFPISVSEVLGDRREPGHTLIYRDRVVNVRGPKCRVEFMVDGAQAEQVVAAIRDATTAGCPGQVSDAKILVMQLDECMPAHRREHVRN